MKNRLIVHVLAGLFYSWTVCCLPATLWGQVVAIDLESAQVDPDFALQGEYRTAVDANESRGVQVVALGQGNFRVVIYTGGLPGAGWNRQSPQVIPEEDREGVHELLASLQVQKVERSSPTLGVKPPQGAIVLFDGTKETFAKHWQQGSRITDDGLLMEGATTSESFGDYLLHLEFLTPYMPQARGQGRGNSGIYHQARYETQILDSFGLEGKNNETGGLYSIRDPDLNMCFPPLVWQTYDVELTSARFDAEGQKVSNARITVRLNGVVVQQDVELPRPTPGNARPESPEPGPIYLQNHGNPVRFRNIWLMPRDAEREARRPRIPGFERFHANADDALAGGELLIGELGCVKCHQADGAFVANLDTKQAPVLTEVGKRVRPNWLVQYLNDPQGVKPGTAMPHLLGDLGETERVEAVQALANFLASTGRVAEQSPQQQAANQGRKHFHEIGCVACHAPLEGPTASAATTVPLANLPEKYSAASLADFLQDPHKVRPSGRMPNFNLNDKEREELSQYLAGGTGSLAPPNVRYQAYHGSWDQLPNFDELTPVKTGTSTGLDLSVAERRDHFAIRFEGFYVAERDGNYRFWLGSDDGSALYIDGEKVVDVDGIHPHSVKQGAIRLSQGVHAVRVDYFEQAGEESLTLEVQPPRGSRMDASLLLTLHADGTPVEAPPRDVPAGQLVFERNPALVDKGRELFVSFGCVNCHEMRMRDEQLTGTRSIELARLQSDRGCLGTGGTEAAKRTESTLPVPDFALAPAQQRAIQRVLSGLSTENNVVNSPSPAESDESRHEQRIEQAMTRFNCYACHERAGRGGPEFDRNPLFLGLQPEMGDEGRLPPPLNGVGDKLQEGWLRQVLANGANDRPYMLTRMPKFGEQQVGHLTESFVSLDRREESQLAQFDEAEHRIKATGRELVGDQALACIKCHTFGPHRATGIQAISLTEMHKRVREDWFLRYLYEPAKYRPGTRMPTGFPDGQAVVRNVYDGDPNQQISAIWTYLQDGPKAGIPVGLVAQMIELKPVDEPIIYRNFIEGLSPRGIAVGYPEQAHLAWDANDLCLKLIWHNRFIDASKHWVGRGAGNQVPLGDHQLQFEPTIPFAQLASRETPWPQGSPRGQAGYQFKGYQLNDAGQPTFAYDTPFATITDFPRPVPGPSGDAGFERTFEMVAPASIEDLYFRAAVGNRIEQTPHGFLIDGALTVIIEGGGEPWIRESQGKLELLVPLHFDGIATRIVQRIHW